MGNKDDRKLIKNKLHFSTGLYKTADKSPSLAEQADDIASINSTLASYTNAAELHKLFQLFKEQKLKACSDDKLAETILTVRPKSQGKSIADNGKKLTKLITEYLTQVYDETNIDDFIKNIERAGSNGASENILSTSDLMTPNLTLDRQHTADSSFVNLSVQHGAGKQRHTYATIVFPIEWLCQKNPGCDYITIISQALSISAEDQRIVDISSEEFPAQNLTICNKGQQKQNGGKKKKRPGG